MTQTPTLNGVVLRKLELLNHTLADLRTLGEVRVAQLEEDWRTKRAVERSLQILVEIMIDVCQRLLSVSGQTPATSGQDAIERCVQLGALSSYEAYENMVKFRNFIVHLYERVETPILVNLVNRRLGDFEQFRDEILAYVHRS